MGEEVLMLRLLSKEEKEILDYAKRNNPELAESMNAFMAGDSNVQVAIQKLVVTAFRAGRQYEKENSKNTAQ